jgi:hypothetical protein
VLIPPAANTGERDGFCRKWHAILKEGALRLPTIGPVELLDRDEEKRLAQIIQHGAGVERRALELAETLGHEPTESYLAADLGFINAAHIRLALVSDCPYPPGRFGEV